MKDKKLKAKELAMNDIELDIKGLPANEQSTLLLSKISKIIEENIDLKANLKDTEKKLNSSKNEKERIELDHGKNVLVKSRLESLCRELQKQNKLIKDENISRLKEEENKRKEVSNKLNSTLSEISNIMNENTQRNSKLREENENMASRLQDLIKEHEAREIRVEKAIEQKKIEIQILETKLEKSQLEYNREKERSLAEKKILLERVEMFTASELSLRTQLTQYIEKFDELKAMFDKSNGVLGEFKTQMSEMSSTIKKLEKEAKGWKQKWESCNASLMKMVTERGDMQNTLESEKRKLNQLQNLCRAMQKENSELRKQIKSTDDSCSKGDLLLKPVDTTIDGDNVSSTSDNTSNGDNASQAADSTCNGDNLSQTPNHTEGESEC